MEETPYRLRAFAHWLNLAFVAGAGAAGLLVDPGVWMVAAPIELGALWVLPDLPPFRAYVDRKERWAAVAREREYCLSQLWGLQPRKQSLSDRLLGWFVEPEDVPDDRVLSRDELFEQYREMRTIVAKLVELETVRGVPIVSRDLLRFEQVING
jgi:hypothetical protein